MKRSGRGFVAAMVLALAGCARVAVVQGVGEVEANQAVVALERAGVETEKLGEDATGNSAPSFRVTVDEGAVPRAVAVLNASGLPRRAQPGFQETFGAASMIPSANEERTRTAQAIAGELSRSIERIDGVLDARVHVSIADPHESLIEGPTPARSTASVLVRYTGASPPYDPAAVQRLVAGAVTGLRTEDVAIVGLAHALPSEASLPVARGRMASLRSWLIVSVIGNALFGLAIAALWLRRAQRPESR